MVAATCYDAADRGYRITVLRDGCADGDPMVHDFFMDKVFPSRGLDVVSCLAWPTGERST
jgi:nicotinamidase-related amidase